MSQTLLRVREAALGARSAAAASLLDRTRFPSFCHRRRRLAGTAHCIAAGVLLATLLLSVTSLGFAQPEAKQKSFSDPTYKFTLAIPDSFEVMESASDAKAFQRLSLKNKAKPFMFVGIYALRGKRDIDLKRFVATLETSVFTLGRAKESSRGSAVEKRYFDERKGLHSLVHFEVSGQYGYAIVARSKSENLEGARSLILGFAPPVSEKPSVLMSGLGSIAMWLIGIVAAVLLGVAASIIGNIGLFVRKGTLRWRSIGKMIAQAKRRPRAQGEDALRILFPHRRRALMQFTLPIAGCIALYTALGCTLETKSFLVSLVPLIPFSLGFFGIVLGPSSDPEDYM